MKFETVLYAFAMLLLVLISLPDGSDNNPQEELFTSDHTVDSNQLNIAVAQPAEYQHPIALKETEETESSLEDH